MKIMNITAVTLALLTSAALVQAQEPKRVQGFSVLLLVGATQGAAAPPENISAPARKALADIKDFLPYKSYRVLDTVWVAGTDTGNSSGGFSTENGPYHFELNTFPRVIGAKPGTADAVLGRAKFTLQLFPTNGYPSTVLNNSFDISTGDTVVVGTSRLQGDTALVVLLTAVPANK
jgi:hypothetical protein